MENEKVQFNIQEQAVITRAVELAEASSRQAIKEQTKNFQWWIAAIVIICVLGFLQMLTAYFQFTSSTYREYRGRVDTQDALLETNKLLLEKVEAQQKQIIDLFGRLPKPETNKK